jgi:hypothetical protein
MSDRERLIILSGANLWLGYADLASSHQIALDKVSKYLREYDETLRRAFA